MPFRRIVLAAITTAVLSLALAVPALAGRATKVPICHHDSTTDSWSLISINVTAVASHLAHGDALPGTGPFDESCGLVDTATVFAVAWTDKNANHTYELATDVLIARLIDGNGNDTLDSGDVIETGAYPLDFGASAFGSFTVTSHVVDSVSVVGGQTTVYDAAGHPFRWQTPAIWGAEQYVEAVAGLGAGAELDDSALGAQDAILMKSFAPSVPAIEVGPILSSASSTNDAFIDVAIYATAI
jgi:hypothetical protein